MMAHVRSALSWGKYRASQVASARVLCEEVGECQDPRLHLRPGCWCYDPACTSVQASGVTTPACTLDQAAGVRNPACTPGQAAGVTTPSCTPGRRLEFVESWREDLERGGREELYFRRLKVCVCGADVKSGCVK